MAHPHRGESKADDTIETFEQAPEPTRGHDEVAPEAIGGADKSELPRGYYWSPKFIGTMVATSLMLISLYLGYVLPVCGGRRRRLGWRLMRLLDQCAVHHQRRHWCVALTSTSMSISANASIGPDPNYVLIPITKTLGGGVGLLLVGRIGDIFGRRWVYISAQILGTIGSIMAATGNSINTLLGATAFIGEFQKLRNTHPREC